MRTCLLLSALFAAGGADAQTRAIAHKSHGGSAAEFAAIPEEAGADFGLSPEMERRMELERTTVARIDSVIYLSDSSAIAVRRTYRRGVPEGAPFGAPIATTRDTLRFEAAGPEGSLASARETVRAWYGNEAKVARYVGFGKKKPVKPVPRKPAGPRPEHSVLPVPPRTDDPGAGGNDPEAPIKLPFLLSGIACAGALLAGGITWLYRRMPTVS